MLSRRDPRTAATGDEACQGRFVLKAIFAVLGTR
jgi:hypothetical protein